MLLCNVVIYEYSFSFRSLAEIQLKSAREQQQATNLDTPSTIAESTPPPTTPQGWTNWIWSGGSYLYQSGYSYTASYTGYGKPSTTASSSTVEDEPTVINDTSYNFNST